MSDGRLKFCSLCSLHKQPYLLASGYEMSLAVMSDGGGCFCRLEILFQVNFLRSRVSSRVAVVGKERVTKP